MQPQLEMTDRAVDESIRAPGPHLIALEGRAVFEYAAAIAMWPRIIEAIARHAG